MTAPRTSRTTKIETPEPGDLEYIYDFSSIFATPEQEQMYAGPYRNTIADLTRRLRNKRNLAQGGQIEEQDDMLLRIIGEM